MIDTMIAKNQHSDINPKKKTVLNSPLNNYVKIKQMDS